MDENINNLNMNTESNTNNQNNILNITIQTNNQTNLNISDTDDFDLSSSSSDDSLPDLEPASPILVNPLSFVLGNTINNSFFQSFENLNILNTSNTIDPPDIPEPSNTIDPPDIPEPSNTVEPSNTTELPIDHPNRIILRINDIMQTIMSTNRSDYYKYANDEFKNFIGEEKHYMKLYNYSCYILFGYDRDFCGKFTDEYLEIAHDHLENHYSSIVSKIDDESFEFFSEVFNPIINNLYQIYIHKKEKK